MFRDNKKGLTVAGHISAEKFTIHFGPRERRTQLLSIASKVNALVIAKIVVGDSAGFK